MFRPSSFVRHFFAPSQRLIMKHNWKHVFITECNCPKQTFTTHHAKGMSYWSRENSHTTPSKDLNFWRKKSTYTPQQSESLDFCE